MWCSFKLFRSTFTLIVCGFLLSCFTNSIKAQQTLEYPTLGITVNVPIGFEYEENEEGLVLYTNKYPDTYFILTQHEYNHIAEIESIANVPYEEPEIGLKLSKSGDIERIDDNAIGAHFGDGVSVIGLTINGNLNPEVLRSNVIDINNGIKLDEISMSAEIIEWIEKLKNTRLEYRTSYSSNSYSSGGISGYSSSSEAIELCKDGYFNYSGSSSTSMSSGSLGVLGNSNSSKKGNGEWKIEENGAQEPILILNYYNGSTEQYSMYYKKGYLYLNDYKYTIGRGSEYGPSCF